MDVFIILQLSVNDFRVRTKGGKQQHYYKLKQISYFNIINIAECTSEGSVINQSWSMQFPVATFSENALFDSWTIWYVSATWEDVTHI